MFKRRATPTEPLDVGFQFVVYDRAREQGRIRWHGKRLVIGRRVEADIRINEPTMSGLHAEILPSGDGLLLRDLESLNGTRVNGVRVVESLLVSGDEIEIGKARILVTNLEAISVEPTKENRPERLDPSTVDAFDAVVSTESQSGQTVRIKLDHLRGSRADAIREDSRIILLRDIFETLKDAEDDGVVLEKTCHLLGDAFARARVFALRRDDEGTWSVRCSRQHEAATGSDRPPSLTFVEETVASRSAFLSTSLPEDHRFSASESARISGIETAMAVPIVVEDEPMAVLYVDRLGLPPFSVQDLNILGITANHVAAVLENVSRFDALRSTNAELVEARENLAELNRNLEELVEERTVEIRRQAEEIQSLADAKDELMGIAAHDIRGPLTVIQGTAELLRLRAGHINQETLVDSLDMIHGAARSLSQLLSELLDAKAIESGKIRLDLRRTTVADLIHASLPVPRLAAEDKGIQLEVEVESNIHTLADPQRLGQAITNLVLNAVKFSDRGSRILLRGHLGDDDRVWLTVADQGMGIPEEEIGRIFGTFEQGKAGRRLGGSGLGLMIARRLVELHGGELSVESEVGIGSRFSLILPPSKRDASGVEETPA
ncbi:MAG: ATP-binding protein [Acidobacteriota bacterium]